MGCLKEFTTHIEKQIYLFMLPNGFTQLRVGSRGRTFQKLSRLRGNSKHFAKKKGPPWKGKFAIFLFTLQFNCIVYVAWEGGEESKVSFI